MFAYIYIYSFVGNFFTSTVLPGTQTVSLKEEEKKKKGQHTVYAI